MGDSWLDLRYLMGTRDMRACVREIIAGLVLMLWAYLGVVTGTWCPSQSLTEWAIFPLSYLLLGLGAVLHNGRRSTERLQPP